MKRASRQQSSSGPARAAVAGLLGLVLAASGVAVPAGAATAPDAVVVTGLTTNDLVDPLGVGAQAPRFSWQLESDERGVRQSAYEVRVTSGGPDGTDETVWESGTVASDQQIGIEYEGPALERSTRYVWQVRVDAGDGMSGWSAPASFETALLGPEDWDAQWIGDDSADPARWTDYTVDTSITVEPGRAFGVYLRAEDVQNSYMWQLNDTTDGDPFLRLHRRDGGAYTVLADVSLTDAGLTADVLDSAVDLEVDLEGSTLTTTVNDVVVDTREDDGHAGGYVGIRLDGAGKEGGTLHSMQVTDDQGSLYTSDFASGANPFGIGEIVDDGLLLSGSVDSLWGPTLPIFRDDFETSAGRTVTSARLSASALGIYELTMNGKPVGDQELAPGWTDYRDRIQFQTYDVTDLVEDGDNALGAALGAGWYSGYIGWFGNRQYGSDTVLIAQLEITYDDGSTQVVASGDDWTTAPGPYDEADLLMGETFDARRVQTGWDAAGFDDSAWSPVGVVETDATQHLVPQQDPPVRVTQTLPALERTEPSAGTYVYDVGQNMAGVASVRLTGTAGQRVTIRHGETLNADGTLYTANLRSAKATDHYVFAEDGTVTYTPHFTQHGFRYVEITGVDAAPALEDVEGKVFGSDLEITGQLDTSDPMLDQLQSNIQWGQRGNFISVPTDTPARDERLGYTGDLNAFIGTAAYNMDTLTFGRKFLTDVRDNQTVAGNVGEWVPRFASNECCNSGTGWNDAMVTIPWTLWQRYGDTQLLEENYDAILSFFDNLEDSFPGYVRADGPYGDWLNLSDDTPAAVLGTAYYAYDARLMSEMAAALGHTEDAERFTTIEQDATDVFVDEFVSDDGKVGSGSQTSYALALGMDLVPADLRDAAADRLVANIEAHDDHLTTGFVGTPWLMPALSAAGRWDTAYSLLQQTTIPSWGYEVEMGATTMWERWDTVNPDGSFNDPAMNSFNHYAFGAVGDWMYQHVAGIQPLEAGYRSFEVAPRPGGTLTHAEGTYESRYGTISSSWVQSDDAFTLDVEVPPGTTATVRVPTSDAQAVMEGGAPVADAEGVEDVAPGKDEVVVTVGSGRYAFSVGRAGELLAEALTLADRASAEADDLHADGVLDDAAHDAVGTALDDVTEHARAAVVAESDAATASAVAAVVAARAAVAALDEDGSGAGLGDLADLLDRLESTLQDATARLAGFRAEVAVATDDVLPGDTADVDVSVHNDGAGTLADVVVTPEPPAGWEVVGAEPGDVAAGSSAEVSASVQVPTAAVPAAVDVPVRVVAGIQGTPIAVVPTAVVHVSSPLTVVDATIDPASAGPGDAVVARVEVRNDGPAAVDGRVQVAAPDDDWAPGASATTTFEPGTSRVVEVDQHVPVTVSQEKVGLDLEVRGAGDVVYTSTPADLTVAFGDPGDEALDHVDLGDGASESSHGLEASARSGTGTEAGLTRRYTTTDAGNFFSFDATVPVDEPFVLRALETYDAGGRVKRYTVLVDGHVVQSRVHRWTQSSGGSGYYQILVDDPEALSVDGTARITISRDTDEDWDPSLADVWTLAAPPRAADPKVEVTVSPRCLAGKAYVAVRAQNTGEEPVDVTLTTPFGSRSFVAVAPGSSAYQSFASRAAAVDDGVVTVTVQQPGGGEPSEQEVAYDARAC